MPSTGLQNDCKNTRTMAFEHEKPSPKPKGQASRMKDKERKKRPYSNIERNNLLPIIKLLNKHKEKLSKSRQTQHVVLAEQ